MDVIASLLPEGIGPVVAGLLIVASFFTSALTAATGVGGGSLMLMLMGMFVPVAALIPVHGTVQLGSNTGRAFHQRANVRFDIFKPFLIGSLIGALVGAFFVVQLPDAILKIVLGGFILMITWTKIPGLNKISGAGLAIGSGLTALVSMFVGATGPLLGTFFGQIVKDRKQLVATLAAGMTVQHFLKIVVFGLAGFAFAQWIPLVACMIVTGFLGTIYGTRMLDRIPDHIFQIGFKVIITLLALEMIRRGVLGL